MASNAPLPAQDCLKKVIRKFIPKELIPDTWKCDKPELEDNLQDLLTKAHHQLGMFASVHILMGHINQYSNFPKSMEYFDMNILDHIETTPHQHKSMTDKEKGYIYKNDIYKVFNYCPLQGATRQVALMILEQCWNLLRAGTHHEMAAYPRISTPPLTSDKRELITDFEGFLNKWKEDAKGTINILIDVIWESMMTFFGEAPLEQNSEEYTEILKWVGLIMERVAEYAKKESVDLPPLNSITQKTAVIRVFSFDDNQFVMAHELLDTLKKHELDVSGIEEEVLGMPKLSTFSYADVTEKVGDDVLNQLEFAKVQVLWLMFAQTPIPTYEEGHCILAVDVLYELLIDIIVAKKMFHIDRIEIWNCIKEFLEAMEFYFDPSRGIYFLDFKDIDAIKKYWVYVYSNNLKRHSSNAKQFKKTYGSTFSMKEFKDELEYLNLKKSFGDDIMNHADLVYATFPAENGGLSLSDFHLTVIRCQINCVVRKVPKLLEFIHNQGACERMNIVACDLCLEEVEEN